MLKFFYFYEKECISGMGKKTKNENAFVGNDGSLMTKNKMVNFFK